MGKSIRCAVATAAGAVVFTASAFAQNGPLTQSDQVISNPGGMVVNFDIANLGPVLNELGVAWEQRSDDEGRPFIAAAINNEFFFNVIPTACLGQNNTGCVGVNFLALFSGPSPNLQTVAAFNQKYFFSSAGAFSDGSGAYLSRYEIADYGIPRGNVASSLGSFVYLANAFQNEISTAASTVSLDGFAEDMASNYLNQQSTVAVTGAGDGRISAAAKHRDGFEEAPILVRQLMNTKQAARNKIENNRAK